MKKLLAAAAALIILTSSYLIVRRTVSRQAAPDAQLVQAVVFRGEKALINRDFRNLMECVSADYKDGNGLTYPVLRARLAQALRTEDQYDLKGMISSIRVEGDMAEVVYEGRLTVGGETVFNNTINLYLKKENVRRFVIFPAKEWRIITAHGYPGSIAGY